MKTLLLLALLLFSALPAVADDLLALCINAAVAQAGAAPTTLALRASLTATDATEEQRRTAAMKLNAIYNAAVASGRMECLRIRAIQSEQMRQQAQERMLNQLLLLQSWNQNGSLPYPFYPR